MKKEIHIGITGHRDIIITKALIEQLNNFFALLLEEHPHGKITLLSPLAEGADRLVAQLFLIYQKKHKQLKLIVPMPFDQERYQEDFDTDSQQEFTTLLNASEHAFSVERVHESGYVDVGYYVVDHADMLLALWDGTFNGKIGGTGDIVNYAKERSVEVLHFHCERNSS